MDRPLTPPDGVLAPGGRLALERPADAALPAREGLVGASCPAARALSARRG